MKLMTILAAGLLLFACGSKKNATEGESGNGNATKRTTMNVVKVKATTGQFVKDSDPIISIDTVEIKGNTMYIDLSYGGGCQKHTFEVIGSLAIAKSYPPIRSLQIVHHANGDNCRAIQTTTLEVDLKDVAYKQEEGSEIYYSIEGWEGRVYHKYANEK